jgi:ATP-dependent DNA helicase RecG
LSSRPLILDALFQSNKALSGVGPRLTKLIDKLIGEKILHLLWHLPVGAIDRRASPDLNKAESGQVITVAVTVDEHIAPRRPGLPLRVHCSNATGTVELTFFNTKGDYLQQQLPVGQTRVISGRCEYYNGLLQIPHPDYIVAPENRDTIPAIEPVYPLTAGLVGKTLQKIMTGALARVPTLDEWLDAALTAREKWPAWKDAVLGVHHPQRPEDLDPLSPARRRLAYDELLANQLTLALIRRSQKKMKGRVLSGDDRIYERALNALPFTLTGAQQSALADIRKDMASPERMNRLLQGDVGSGKTAVAFLAAATAAGAQVQAAIMAPTEILARQHEHKLTPLAAAAGLNVVTLTGRDKGKARDKILEQIKSGDAHIVIGTHALFQDDVAFHDLGLVIIDEQHRFGVHQRLQLSEKGEKADMLVMTATPIPRTLTLTLYGDMDVSRLNEKPAGRLPIDTRTVSNERIDEVIEALARKVAGGERAYWVCPLIEESEKLDLAAAEQRFITMQQHFGPRTALLHGQMKAADKDAIMTRFASGEIDVLVSTTVIEVGVDVPEATVMVIEHAERFGLSQLHQLRGRIGRGSGKSTCLLLFDPKYGETAKKRLNIMKETEDGFLISEQDLKLRGAGEILGTKQSGLPQFRLANLEAHADMIAMAQDDARLILHKDENLKSPRGAALRTLLYVFECDAAMKYLRAG